MSSNTILRRAILVALHLVLIPVGYGLAFLLRLDWPISPRYVSLFWETLPLLLVLRLGAFAAFRLLQGWWRYVGMYDLVALFKAVSTSSALFVAALFLLGYAQAFPRSIFVLDWCVAFLLFGGIRFGVRWLREGTRQPNGGKRTLVIGAGDVGAQLVRQARRDPLCGIRVIGLVDDDPSKGRLDLHGVPVLGTTRDLQWLAIKHEIELIIVAIAAPTRDEMQKFAERIAGLKVEFKVVPSLVDLMDGKARLDQLRPVEIEDLLGRPSIRFDLAQVDRDLHGEIVLITGAAGSIGSELARQIAAFGPERLVLLEQAESPLFFIHAELVEDHPDLDLVPVIADVTDAQRVEQVFADCRPAYVFHAAAYKHVPLMEVNVEEAIRTNVIGTFNVARSAVRYGAARFVLISTDKAVRPASVMGATKRIAERLVLGWPEFRFSSTDFRAVRFGNVLGSTGSVVPVFRKQIAAGGPVTVTHPEMKRYFMTIPEAVQLVLQAASVPEAAQRISLLEMGEPVKILEMAENLIRFSGLEPYTDIPIVFTGIRPGEKLHEDLMSEVEEAIPTTVEKVRILHREEVDEIGIRRGLLELEEALVICDRDRLLRILCELVPECTPPLRERGKRAEARFAERARKGEVSLDRSSTTRVPGDDSDSFPVRLIQ